MGPYYTVVGFKKLCLIKDLYTLLVIVPILPVPDPWIRSGLNRICIRLPHRPDPDHATHCFIYIIQYVISTYTLLQTRNNRQEMAEAFL